jgi:thiamine-monophosphate kinase
MKLTPGESLRKVGEDRLVARFRDIASSALTKSILVGPGDDAAAVRTPGGRLLLITCDMMTEGIHFRRDWATPWQIGWKAMVQNISDIAAMGGEPAAAVASLAAPGDLPAEVPEEIARGLVSAASEYGAALVGGDLVGSPGPIVVDVALTGWVEEGLMLRRRGARPGDAIAATGALGASAAGLAWHQQGLPDDSSPEVARVLQAHHEPRPRLSEARAIAKTGLATSMMDLSDGLADDLPRLCAESGVGARVWCNRIPVDPACLALSRRIGKSALEMAIIGGEDYELLLTCSPSAVEQIAAAVLQIGGPAVTVIGEIVERTGVSFLGPDGEPMLPGSGFDHFAPSNE